MVRRKSTAYRDWTHYDLIESVPQDTLALVGAICLEWNFIEDIFDRLVSEVAGIRYEFAAEITSRINGFEGKKQVVVKGLDGYSILQSDDVEAIKSAIAHAFRLKQCRDNLVHARLYDPSETIVGTFTKHGSKQETLFERGYLSDLYNHLRAMSDEIVAIYRLLDQFSFRNYPFEDDVCDPVQLRSTPKFLDLHAQVAGHRAQRLALPQLPVFRDEPDNQRRADRRFDTHRPG